MTEAQVTLWKKHSILSISGENESNQLKKIKEDDIYSKKANSTMKSIADPNLFTDILVLLSISA